MTFSVSKTTWLAFFAVATSSTTMAFTSVTIPASVATTSAASPLKALIFGWDGAIEDETTTASSSASSYTTFSGSNMFGESCSPVGTAVAETLSADPDRTGHLARLAVAFAPPSQALTLDKIDKVDVICVREDQIEIEAILCDGTTGCLSLSIPVKFPRGCQPVKVRVEWKVVSCPIWMI